MGGKRKTVFVSGCYDLLHSGHVAFLQAAAEFGDLIVAVGSDQTVRELKGKCPANSQEERLFMLRALRCVKRAFISSGRGVLDFDKELREVQPDLLVVNRDGHFPEKEGLCAELGIEYRVMERQPAAGLPARSTSTMRSRAEIPYRIDLAGGWLDQPFVSRYYPGPVVVVSVEPDHAFEERSGMATSTRSTAIRIWGSRIPSGDPQELAKVLFCCENPPGKTEISGSQDALGIMLPGVSRLDYEGDYWPVRVDSIRDDETLSWLESVVSLRSLGPRPEDFCVLADVKLTRAKAERLANAAGRCWYAIGCRATRRLGEAISESFAAQVDMFPQMLNPGLADLIAGFRTRVAGLKLAGAGGGGYLVLISDAPPEGGLSIRIRRAGT